MKDKGASKTPGLTTLFLQGGMNRMNWIVLMRSFITLRERFPKNGNFARLLVAQRDENPDIKKYCTAMCFPPPYMNLEAKFRKKNTFGGTSDYWIYMSLHVLWNKKNLAIRGFLRKCTVSQMQGWENHFGVVKIGFWDHLPTKRRYIYIETWS